MKDMVSKVHGSRLRPTWIKDTIWQQMCAYWDTEEGVQRSEIYSKARNSDRGGLGPFKTFTGQKSFLQIHQEMEEELGRPVSFAELFLKTHTKSDGTYVDRKAQQVAESYEKNLQAKLAEVDPETSDGTSRNQELSTNEYNDLFLKSSIVDERGRPYGIGSLAESHVSGKRKFPGSSSSTFNSLQLQLQETQRQLEAQASHNSRLEERLQTEQTERARLEERIDTHQSQQAASQQHFTLIEQYLRKTDPAFLDFIASQSGPNPSSP